MLKLLDALFAQHRRALRSRSEREVRDAVYEIISSAYKAGFAAATIEANAKAFGRSL